VHDGGPQLYNGAEDCFDGHGACASMPDYLKILQSILQDDEKLLKKETSKIMFEPQLSVESREAMKQTWSIPAATKLFVGEFPQGIATDWGIEGLLLFPTFGDTFAYLLKSSSIHSHLYLCKIAINDCDSV